MEKSPPQFDACRQTIEDKLLGLQLSLSNNEEIDYEDLRQMLTQIITPTVSQPEQQDQELILDSPFKWKPISEKNSPTERIKAALEKKSRYKNEHDSQWSIIVLNLVLCYEYVIHENNRAAASELVAECETMLTECVDPAAFAHQNRSAFQRVISSTRYHVSTDPVERATLLSAARPHAELSQAEVAAMWGLRGAVHMEYGYTGNKMAEMYLHTAIKFEPDVAQWHFLYGQCLGRLRHINFNLNLPRDIELISLERAVELSKNPYFVAYLAQAYREAATSLFWQRDGTSDGLGADLGRTAERMNARASQLYEEALELCPDCPYINVRCAQGYMRFHGAQRDYRRAYECCRTAVEACPENTMINHVWGQINERVGNYKVATKHLRIAAYQGAFGAYMDLIRLSFRNNKQYDPRPLFQDMLKNFTEDPYQIEANVQMGMYYHIMMRDTVTAADYIMKGVDIDPLSDKLKNHRSVFSKGRGDINVYSVLIEAADNLPSEEERKAKFGRAISVCKANFPELLESRSRVPKAPESRFKVPERRDWQTQQRPASAGGNWRNNQQGDGNWRRGGEGGGAKMCNWRDPESRGGSNGSQSYSQNGGRRSDRYRCTRGRMYTHSEGSVGGQRSDYGSWSDVSSLREGTGSDYDSGTWSDAGSVRSSGRNGDGVKRLADVLANQRLGDGAGDRAGVGKAAN